MKNRNQAWRYLIVAGALLGAYGGWQTCAGHFTGSLGSETMALACVVAGLLAQRLGRREKN